MEAIESGDEAGVKRCLDDGADALFADDEGFSALHMAAQEGYAAVVVMLLRKGAKIDATDDDGVTPLMLACAGGHEDTVNTLVNENADVLLADKKGKTALLRAAAVAGSNPPRDASSTRRPANGRVPRRRQDPRRSRRQEESRMRQTHRPRALPGGRRRALEAAERTSPPSPPDASNLVADPNAVVDDDGWTALHFAAAEGTPELVRLLLQKGFSADAEAKDGATPVELAEEEEHEDACEDSSRGASSRRRGRARVVVQSSSDAIRLVSLASSAVGRSLRVVSLVDAVRLSLDDAVRRYRSRARAALPPRGRVRRAS